MCAETGHPEGPILVCDGVRRAFGGLVAVDIDHLEVERGSITALIGPNGAGKTTLFNVLSGFDRADAGEWTFAGRRLRNQPAHAIARLGMVRTFQLTKVLGRMSVIDNMRIAATDQPGERFTRAVFPRSWRAQERRIDERATDLLEVFGLARMRDAYAATLSGGQRKLLELARAVMTAPQMLMLDEPVAGVNPTLTRSILDHITGLREDGMTILFVEHDMDVVMGIGDRVVCMAAGRVIADGPPADVARDEAVIDAYLGTR